MKMSRIILPIILLLLFSADQLNAQPQPKVEHRLTPWYIGMQGGIPLGVSTFSSFGADNARVGYQVGAMIGYRINHLFSTEFSTTFGRVELGSNKCCTDYWLGADGMHYVSPVAGMRGYYYRNLYSSVAMQQLGLHFNIDLTQLIKHNETTRWSVLLSPAIYGVGTQASMKAAESHNQLFKTNRQFNFGVGAGVGIGYRIAEQWSIRFSSGLNCITGSHYDGIPDADHNENFVWNNSLSFIWQLGRSK